MPTYIHFFGIAGIIFLRIQLQKSFKSEVFKDAGSRDHLLPCHTLLLEVPAGSLLHWKGLGLPPAVQDRVRDMATQQRQFPEVKTFTESTSGKVL